MSSFADFTKDYLNEKKKKKTSEEERQSLAEFNKSYFVSTRSTSDDIAPVRLTEQEQQMGSNDERKWFQKGAFEDGYQFGDLTKTMESTMADLRTNLSAGILGIGEKVVDAGAYLVGGVGGLFSKDFQERTKDFITKDLYDEEAVAKTIVRGTTPSSWLDESMVDEDNSVLGEKTDALAQSGGQLLGTAALQAVGVPWYLTSGVTSFGSEAENAFNQGATYGQAGLSAAITAGAEILTEKISGGISFGGKTLDDGLTNLIASNISKKTAQALLKFGVDAAGEGFEEVFSNAISAVGQKITYDENKDISFGEMFLSEEAFENFIGGAVLGGGSNLIGNVTAKKQGKDAVTGLSIDEQKVVDKVFKDAVAEAEEGGKKLSAKQKTDLYNEVLNKLEKGYIDIDTIEETLGDDVYKSYKDTIDYEDDILKQYEELGKKTNPTLAEMSLYDELKSQYNDIKQNSQRDYLKENLSNEVFGKVKDTKLAESYNERARRGQVFEADLSQYDENLQEAIKSAIDDGVLNNTNRSHEVVESVAKISSDTGARVHFVNNAKLKEMGVDIDGVDVNGFVGKDGTIYVNVESHQMWETTIGHEITHVFEGTKEHYEAFKKAMTEYAKMKGEYDSKLEKVTKLYEEYDPTADPEKELMADLVGEYLFTDEDFVRHLSTNHRNVFQKIYDAIKNWVKSVTAGSKEAKQLEEVKRTFEKMYRESGKTQTKTSEGTKYSISADSQKADADYLDAVNRGDTEAAQKMVDEAAKDAGYTIKAYHGSRKVFNEFSKEKRGTNTHTQISNQWFFAADKETANSYYPYGVMKELQKQHPEWRWANPETLKEKGKLYHLYLKMENPLVVDVADYDYASHQENADAWMEYVHQAEINDNDGIILLNAMDNQLKTSARESTVYMFRDSNQAKSADTVTYDDNGNVIPLSERFNTGSNDIRYSLSESEDSSRDYNGATYNGKDFWLGVADLNGNIVKTWTYDEAEAIGFDAEYEVLFDEKLKDGYRFFTTDLIEDNGRIEFDDHGDRLPDDMIERINEQIIVKQSTNKDTLAENIRKIHSELGNTRKTMNNIIPHISGVKMLWEQVANNEITSSQYNEFLRKDSYFKKLDDKATELQNEFDSLVEELEKLEGKEWKELRSSVLYGGSPKYSLSDSDGKQLTKGQQEYFKDSKVRDKDGNLLKVYHTTNSDFTVFDKTKQGDATGDSNTYMGFFFSDDAEHMQNFPGFENGKTDSYYLNITNPIDMTNISKEAFMDVVEVLGGDVVEAEEVYDAEGGGQLISLLNEMTGDADYRTFVEELKPHYNELMSRGYDGIINSLDIVRGAKEYIVLDSNQAKLVSNTKPTSNPDVRYSLSSIANTFFGDENMSAIAFEQSDYKNTDGYKNYVDQCVNNLRQSRVDFDEVTARREIEDSIDGIVNVALAAKRAGYDIYDDATKRNTKDSKNRLLFSSLEPNSDYFTSSDISTECDKRKNFADIYDAIVKKEEAMGVPQGKRFFDNVDNYFYIHKVLADKGLTQPCKECYVESMRKNLAPMANAFLRLVGETNSNNTANDQLYEQKGKNKGKLKSNNAATREWVLDKLSEYGMTASDLSVETLTTEDGLAQLKIQAPMIYEAFNSFYGQSKPKMPKSATPFRFGELTALLTDHNGKIKQGLVDKINHTGGFRLQSYSDFQIQNYTDVLQVIFEAGTLGLNGHAYTKVPAFLDATEGTNLKRNISIFMYKDGNEWKIDRNDSFPYTLEEIYDIVNADKSGNTSIIAVSQNNEMSAWIMANDNVGYGIPFHKSGLKMGTVRDTDVKTEDGRIVKGYADTKDHTKQQTEVWAKTTDDHKAFTKVNKGIDIYEIWDFDNANGLPKNELIEKNVKAYIDACEEAGYIPKFRDYVMNNGKVLNDVLRFAKEMGYATPDATIADISFEYKGYTIPYGYYKFLGDFGMFTPDGQASPQKALSLQNYDFDKAVEFFADSEALHRNEILQQFANGAEREYYRNSDLTAEQLTNIVQRKRGEVADEIVGKRKNSLSYKDEAPIQRGTPLRDLRLEQVAPVEGVTENATTTPVAESVVPVTADFAPTDKVVDGEAPIITVKQKLTAKQRQYQAELDQNKKLRDEAIADYDAKIAKAQAEYDSKKNKSTKLATTLARRIERLKRLKGSVDADFKKRISDIETRMSNNEEQLLRNHDRADRLEQYRQKADRKLEAEKRILFEDFERRKSTLQNEIADKDAYISQKAAELYKEISNLKKGVRASKELGYILDHGFDWKSIKAALINAKNSPGKMVNSNPQNANYKVETVVREMLNEDYESRVYDLDDIDTEYAEKVAKLEEEYQKNYDAFKVANQRMTKQQEYSDQMEELVGDTTTWVDKKMGLSYKVNTLRRNLRDIVRDASGKKDIAKADAIYDELQGKYNHNEASLNRESNKLKKPYADMKFTKAEDAYIQMLGEFRHNPDTTLTEDAVKEFYEKNKDKIDEKKVDKAIEMARATYDDLLLRVNEVLRKQGMKEIPYRKGYFPHFTEEKQGILAKLFNWKTQNNDIPTDIAGLTEQFNPNRSWQSFNKQRKTDTTDYSFTRGLDTYVHGALDWIYHIEDIQKRRALENHIRYIHSEQGVKSKIDAIRKNETYDADEMQEQIDLVYREARNPLNNFVTDLRAGTNRLANKKSSLDRSMEEMTNRKIYSTMTNISNRVTGNMVAGSVSSALTNFIPITQSWGEVSPISTLRAMGDTIKAIARDDGTIDKSDFLTNRLKKEENLHKTTWDKVGDKLGLLMEGIDNFTSQTVWRSKYLENISKGMSESEAIKNADQFAENVMAGRSRGNNPTLFDSKNPLVKTLTAFQLEVNNQYGYMFKDMPQDVGAESKGKLVKGYVAMFLGAYAYNALYSSLTGRDAAFDPIGIVEDLLRDLGLFGDDEEEEEPIDAFVNLGENIVEELPFIGGLAGGGRIPISSALPYDGIGAAITGTIEDISEEDWSGLTKEWLNPVYYVAMPMGGGQLKKTFEGLSMFSNEHPVSGSYTDSGNLRFPVEPTVGNVAQAAIFGQWASKNAREYFDNNIAPLNEKQTQEYIDVGMPIQDYWDYRKELSKYKTLGAKVSYIDSLDLTVEQKNILVNNIADRKEDIDMSDYGDFANFDEFDFYNKNPDLYTFLENNGFSYRDYKNADEDGKRAYTWAYENPSKFYVAKAVSDDFLEYYGYKGDINDITADKDEDGKSISGSRKKKVAEYINNLDISYEEKIVLFKSVYKSDDSYNREIIQYLNNREDITYEEMVAILQELGFTVKGDTVSWD